MNKLLSSLAFSAGISREDAAIAVGAVLISAIVMVPSLVAFSQGIQPLSETWVLENIVGR